MRLPGTADVVVVGSGITGAATAAAAAMRGASVVVIDKEDGPATEGSGRAQGSLRLQGRHASEFPLALEALQLWNQTAREDPDIDIEFANGGNLYFCTTEDERPRLMSLVVEARSAGLVDVEFLDRKQASEIIPAATGPFLGAMWSPVDAQCQPDKATGLYVRRAERAGTNFAYRVKATRLLESGGRITGVETVAGRIDAGAVVVAAGIWTPHLLATLGLKIPIMPVCLTEVETQATKPLFAPSIRAFGFGARQRPSGRMVVSGGLNARLTRRFSLYDCNGLRYWLPRARSFRKNLRLRPNGRQILREVAHRTAVGPALIPQPSPEPQPDRSSVDVALARLAVVIPEAGAVAPVRYWGGMVDMTPDGLPVIDGSAGPHGLIVIAGLSGHGLALGPVLGEIASDLCLDGSTRRPIASFRLDRFTGQVAPPVMMI
jgi:glycine/D-amino acid oxidase-like deaminating enzyme